MAPYTRANAWNNGGDFNNQDLLWYARGVREMMARRLDDPASWWFFGAIHGEYVTPESLKDPEAFAWKNIPAPWQVPVTPLPSKGIYTEYWNQCQHQSWYFPPWHRGYLMALEAQLRADIVRLKGPASWALPYWDYLGANDEYKIPPAFTQKDLPGNEGPNPLLVTARYGPGSDGVIYVPTRDVIGKHPHDPRFARGPVTYDVMSNDLYIGTDDNTKPPGFGGPETKFSFGGNTSGNLEGNPHNPVHVYVGGQSKDRAIPGLMSDPGLAGLDPIFYLHHSNIDRLWALWNVTPTNTNPAVQKWLLGPPYSGDRKFIMPMPGGKSWVYVPRDVADLKKLDYTYDNLPPSAPAPAPALLTRLTRLGVAAAAKGKGGAGVTPGGNIDQVGATQAAFAIRGVGASTTVNLKSDVRRKLAASLRAASEAAPPDRAYLQLDNVRGARDSYVLSVYVDLPEGENPEEHPELFAGSVSLFGLRKASFKDGSHAGEGLTFILDITPIVDRLHLENKLDVDSLQVTIVPHQEVGDEAKITVGGVRIFRQGHQQATPSAGQ